MSGAHRVADEFGQPSGDAFELRLVLIELCNFLVYLLGSRHQIVALEIDRDQFVLLAEQVESVFSLPKLVPNTSELIIDIFESFPCGSRLLLLMDFLINLGHGIGQLLGKLRASVRDFDIQDAGVLDSRHLHL